MLWNEVKRNAKAFIAKQFMSTCVIMNTVNANENVETKITPSNHSHTCMQEQWRKQE